MKINLVKERQDLYRPRVSEFAEVDVPPMTYLAVDGHGNPNTSPDYPAAVGALYASAYRTKFGFRARTGQDFVVGPLEGLWTSADPSTFTERRKAEWDWTMLIAFPDAVDREDLM